MRTHALIASALLTISGCASLHIEPGDSPGARAAKVVARVPVALATFGLSEAWHSNERVMRSWIGSREADLLMSWGPPRQTLPDGEGGRILVYTESRTYVSPGQSTTTTTGSAQGQVYGSQVQVYGQTQSQTTYTPPQVHQWEVFRLFRLDENGEIVAYSWKGL